MSLNLVRGWYADRADDDGRDAWIPYVQTDLALTRLDIQFDTREDCERFIREEIAGLGWVNGPRAHDCPTCPAPAGSFCQQLDGRSRLTFHDERLKFMHGGWAA